MYTYTQAPAHMSILTIQNIIYTQQWAANRLETDKETDEVSTRNGKPGRSIVLGRQKS